jgi:hypothetical protein
VPCNDRNKVKSCAHCPNTVVLDGRGIWKHTGWIGYSCRDEANVALPTFAEPIGLAWGAASVPNNSAAGRAAVPQSW